MASKYLEIKEKEMFIAFSADSLYRSLNEKELMQLQRKRLDQNTKAKTMYTYKNKILPESENSERYKINEKEFPFLADVAIYDDKIRLTSFEDQIGIMIENKSIATTLKSIFKLAIKAVNKNS